MILQNLYNKVMGFFRQTDIEREETSKDTACNRLRVVLMQDRTNLTPELMERMRKEMVELLSKYVEMDKEALELNLEQDGDQVALMLSIPVIRAKDEEEIKEALAKEDAEKETEKKEEEETAEENETDNGDTEDASKTANVQEDNPVKTVSKTQNNDNQSTSDNENSGETPDDAEGGDDTDDEVNEAENGHNDKKS